MATARELLQQADALMRRNRAGGGQGAPIAAEPPAAVEVRRPAVPAPANEAQGEPSVSPELAAAPDHARDDGPATQREAAPADDFDDFPVLTDAVTDREPISVLGVLEEPGEPSIWQEAAPAKARHDDWSIPAREPEAARAEAAVPEPEAVPRVDAPWPDTGSPDAPLAEPGSEESSPLESAPSAELREPPGAEPVVAEEAPGADALVPLGDEELQMAVERGEAEIETLLRAEESAALDAATSLGADALPRSFSTHDGDALHDAAAKPDADEAVGRVDQARWDALAEEVRMQVLQRLDIFTDTGLQEQLTARLQPIVDRASEDLVAAINQHLGALLRSYVAEAIEREIEKLRRNG